MSLFGSKQEYVYSVLQLQRSLRERSAFEPLGVLVLGRSAREKEMTLFFVYADPATVTGISDVGRSVLASFPQLVAGQVREFFGSPNRVLEWLADSNRGNVLLGPIQHTRSDKPVAEMAFELFNRLRPVDTDAETTSHGRPSVRGFFENLTVGAVG